MADVGLLASDNMDALDALQPVIANRLTPALARV